MQSLIGHQIDKYRVIKQQGLGGMAVVYHAYDISLERDIAIKLIRSDAFAEDEHGRLMKRFEREAKAQSRFSHPNIVPVYDFGEYEGMPYLVMAYYPGGTLKDKTGQPVDIQLAISWVSQIADALLYAHTRGVIHRDVKPSNILFDEKSRPILTDFGIAKLLEESEGTLTDTGLGIGTPEYMAPEQWQGESCEASDQYALGVVLYELLTGKKPFTAETPVAVALKQSSDPLIRPSAYVPAIPEEVENIIYKALANDPANRFESMQAFKFALSSLEPTLSQLIQEKQKRIDAGEITPPSPPTPSSPRSEAETVDLLDPSLSSSVQAESPQQAKDKTPKKINTKARLIGGSLIILIALVIGIWQLIPDKLNHIFNFNESTSTEETVAAILPTQPKIETTVPTVEIAPTFTVLPQITETPSSTPSPTESVASIITSVRDQDGMELAFVPSGEFIFGTDRGSYSLNGTTVTFSSWEVYLDSYWVDKYEVTNAQYTLCVNAGACSPPYRNNSNTHYDYYTNPAYSDYPVVNVDRGMAASYCRWVGGRLPTEAEWEKAGRGTDGWDYPWGNFWSMDKPGNFDNYQGLDEGYTGDTMPVGSYPEGASPYGVMDMMGNVWEWVADYYSPVIFATEPVDNPTGPAYGDEYLLRGGSYRTGNSLLARELFDSYWIGLEEVGFRCVMDEDWEN